jgi:hypothetical protein
MLYPKEGCKGASFSHATRSTYQNFPLYHIPDPHGRCFLRFFCTWITAFINNFQALWHIHFNISHNGCLILFNSSDRGEDKIDDIKDRLYEELEHVFDKFPKY